MNNEQFRRLVGANSASSDAPGNNGTSPAPARTVPLGSRQKSSIPMTPRSVSLSRSDFQRQIAERYQSVKPQKPFKTSAPKGIRLAEGYTDRAKNASAPVEGDDREERLKALEEAFKKEEIDQATFDRLRGQIAGGDLESTHLVKGLDFKLLARVRQGENVYDAPDKAEGADEVEGDVDDAFDQLEDAKVEAVEKDKAAKKGHFSTTASKAGQKRTRDMVLAEMKAARAAAAKLKEESLLGKGFRKIGASAPGTTRIERDSKGREVLIVVDEDGHEKRKVRKTQALRQDVEAEAEAELKAREEFRPDINAKPLGMEVPEVYKAKAPEPAADENMDIFENVGDDYDPLAGLDEASSDDEDGVAEAEAKVSTTAEAQATSGKATDMAPPPQPAPPSAARNYFKDSKSGLVSDETLKAPLMSDPAIQAAFKRAAAMNAASRQPEEDEDDDEARAKGERRRKMLQNADRDAADMDMEFGTSRLEDEADFEDADVKLSKWGNDDDEDGGKGGGSKKRQRGGKKRKGDANNIADVMRVIEQRKSRS